MGASVLLTAGLLAYIQAAEGATALQLLEKFGLPVTYLLITLFIGVRYVWPYVLSKDERHEQMQSKFADTIRQMSSEHSAAMQKVVEAMTALKDEVRETKRQK